VPGGISCGVGWGDIAMYTYCPHCRPFQVLETLDETSEDAQPDAEELRRLLNQPHLRVRMAQTICKSNG